ncbi:hypothetical protein HU200_035916 [Digitaria exilis]|uniref:Uncharacterized protein n=1 Tax=Digitaria exilis TaxID=1010633 RepID=A0A835EIH3_9POAL|nr:hypothetical protein HU200_035916 [Digitaria exilis]
MGLLRVCWLLPWMLLYHGNACSVEYAVEYISGSAAFHFVRGFRGARLASAVSIVHSNAHRVAGTLGAYAAAFYTVESAMSLVCGKDDFWSSITAAAATWSLHGMRHRGGSLAGAV